MSGSSKNMDEVIQMKRKLVEATDAVRKKFNMLKSKDVKSREVLEKFYEPITKPLSSISKMSIKTPPTANPESLTRSRPSSNIPIRQTSSSIPATATSTLDDGDSLESSAAAATISYSPSVLAMTPASSPASSMMAKEGAAEDVIDLEEIIEEIQTGKPNYDKIFGVRVDPQAGKLVMGNATVTISGHNISFWRHSRKLKTYKATPELCDLIFFKRPAALERTVSEREKGNYAEILKLTNVVYKGHNPILSVRGSKSLKYRQIIEPLIGIKKGGGQASSSSSRLRPSVVKFVLPAKKTFSSGTVMDYVYWNKPKELIDRLRVLSASKLAGHTGHDNEIMSLVEELREEGYIY